MKREVLLCDSPRHIHTNAATERQLAGDCADDATEVAYARKRHVLKWINDIAM